MKNIWIRKTVLPQLDIERGIALPLIIAERTQIPLLLQSRKAAIDTWGLTVRHIIPAEGNDIVLSVTTAPVCLEMQPELTFAVYASCIQRSTGVGGTSPGCIISEI